MLERLVSAQRLERKIGADSNSERDSLNTTEKTNGSRRRQKGQAQSGEFLHRQLIEFSIHFFRSHRKPQNRGLNRHGLIEPPYRITPVLQDGGFLTDAVSDATLPSR